MSDVPHSEDLRQLTMDDVQQAEHAKDMHLQFTDVVIDKLQVATLGMLDQPLISH